MFKDAPDEAFHPHTFEEIMEWKVAGWELPADVACIIRTTNLKNFKTKENLKKKLRLKNPMRTKLNQNPQKPNHQPKK